MTPKKQAKHLYRVNVYLGKELYTDLERTALIMGISVATLAKILINTGYQLANSIDANFKEKGGFKNGH